VRADPRSRAQRRGDTEHRLTQDIDVWVASASADGAPYLVPLSFDWDGEVEVLEIDALPQQRGDRFAARTGFDPRAPATPYRGFRISPRRIQAWREVNELPDRELMRDGRWSSDASAGDREGGPAQQMETR
jgi:hypothetical protein